MDKIIKHIKEMHDDEGNKSEIVHWEIISYGKRN